MGGLEAWTVAEPKIVEPSVGAEVGVVRVEKPGLLGRTLYTSLDGMLPALLLSSLSLKKPTDLSDVNFDAKQQWGFF